jgi:hypothetical protein
MRAAQVLQAQVLQARSMPTPPGFGAVVHATGEGILVELSDGGGEGCA